MSEKFENKRILKFHCKNHYFFGDMEFDFTNNGKPVDTVIIAGENGVGKTTLLNLLYSINDYNNEEVEMDLWINGEIVTLRKYTQQGLFKFDYSDGKYHNFTTIYSDVGINYNSQQKINNITNLDVDKNTQKSKSGTNLAQEIEQLLIDINNLDANDYYNESLEARANNENTDSIPLKRRISRFTNAFEFMFGKKLIFKKVENASSQKNIYFSDGLGHNIPLSKLSSGEKQIVFRGGFFLRDKNSLKGATVLIDEPEISLHPEWQKKIMNYYKQIFTDDNGVQTSQIFTVTHSPFIIHNENRYNDKVIILKKDVKGKIYVEEKPSYYDCNSVKVVEDAFNIQDFSTDVAPTLYVEGRTDEKYIKKAAEVYGITLPFEVKWIGHLDANGQEVNTGYTALNTAKEFLITQGSVVKTILLYDCDTNKSDENFGNIYIRHLPQYKNAKKIQKGIENALIFDLVDIDKFYKKEEKICDYGEKKIIEKFQKMDCCVYICGLGNDILKSVFANLRTVLLEILSVFNEDNLCNQ